MSALCRDVLIRQHALAWRLAWHHLDDLSDEELRWRPANHGLHVTPAGQGYWRGEWPAHEGYDLGPPSMAWIAWHIGYWWSRVVDASFGDGSADPEAIVCPDRAEAIRQWLGALHKRWLANLGQVDDDELESACRSRWPFQDRPFADIVAWANVELTKNAAELGYARFLYARRTG